MEKNIIIAEDTENFNKLTNNYQICSQIFSNIPNCYILLNDNYSISDNLIPKSETLINMKRSRDNSSNNKNLFHDSIFSKYNSNDPRSSEFSHILEKPKKESLKIIYSENSEIFKIEKIQKNHNNTKDISNYNNTIYKEKDNDNLLFKFNYYYFKKYLLIIIIKIV